MNKVSPVNMAEWSPSSQQMLLTAWDGGDLRQSYYGDKSATLQQLRDAGADLSFHALPAFGTVDPVHTPALQVQHFDGDHRGDKPVITGHPCSLQIELESAE